jgi:hypothetical protein
MLPLEDIIKQIPEEQEFKIDELLNPEQKKPLLKKIPNDFSCLPQAPAIGQRGALSTDKIDRTSTLWDIF